MGHTKPYTSMREKSLYIYIPAKGQLRKKTYMDKVKCIKKEDGKFIV
jgi:hypothetical protein